jgi:hypothetical protein
MGAAFDPCNCDPHNPPTSSTQFCYHSLSPTNPTMAKTPSKKAPAKAAKKVPAEGKKKRS